MNAGIQLHDISLHYTNLLPPGIVRAQTALPRSRNYSKTHF